MLGIAPTTTLEADSAEAATEIASGLG